MDTPANFDSLLLDSLLADWLGALVTSSVEGIIVLGPAVFGTASERYVHVVHPPKLLDAATALADSDEFGYAWQASASPMVAWQDISRGSYADISRWRLLALAHGQQTMVRIEFALPRARAFECFLLTPRTFHGRAEAAELLWSAMNIWPKIQRAITEVVCPLSPREKKCLALAFDGLTAADTARLLDCSERTVTYHLANAMRKLQVDNKLSAVQRACWFGII